MTIHNQRVAVVTGSSRGIGQAIAEQLCKDDYAVVINYANSKAEAEETVERLVKGGGQAISVKASVADPADRTQLVEAAYEKWGRLDLLVNNAGITSQGRSDLLEATEESWDVVLDTNLKAPFFLSKDVANRMMKQIKAGEIPSGQIINISSISAFAASTNRADYCIAKAGMTMMTSLFASRLGDEGINVYEIAPGVIATSMTDGVKAIYDKRIAEGLTPISRWGQPSDVAAAVSAIAGGQFPFSTGEVFHVDGGFHVRRL